MPNPHTFTGDPKKPLSYEKFGNIVLEERNFEIIRSCALYFIP